uniref:Uncharacterized protein n=1 Tax=Panagrolaimus sp. JU765 TaxID=591449 RepID=A0AC34RSY6_9BILA
MYHYPQKSFHDLLKSIRFGQTVNYPEIEQTICSQPTWIEQLQLSNVLRGHDGCVNTIEWNSEGNLLVSGSDDRQITVWNKDGHEVTNFASGHDGNIFAAKFLRNCNDSKVASGAADGSVVVNQWRSVESGCCERLREWRNSRRIKQIALDQTNDSSFFSCGEDGSILGYDIREMEPTTLFDANQGIKSIATCYSRPTLIAAALSMDGVKIYDIRYMKESLLNIATGHARILGNRGPMTATYLQFNSSGTELIVNFHNDAVYIFDTNLAQKSGPKFAEKIRELRNPSMNLENDMEPSVITMDDVKSSLDQLSRLSTDGTRGIEVLSKMIAQTLKVKQLTGTLNKQIQAQLACLYHKRGALYKQRDYMGDNMAALRDLLNSLELCPKNSLATYHLIEALNKYQQNYEGKQWIEIYKQRFGETPPKLAETTKRMRSWNPLLMKFTRDYSERYFGARNLRTDIKQARFFGGHDEYVIAGSDCGHLFVWSRENNCIVKLLKADDHVVNCAAPHPNLPLIATSGIENVIRFWSPWKINDDKESVSSKAPEHPETWCQRDVTNDRDEIVMDNNTIDRRLTPFDLLRFAVIQQDRGREIADVPGCNTS